MLYPSLFHTSMLAETQVQHLITKSLTSTQPLEVPLEKCKSQQAQQLIVRKHTKKWHATLAGAISGGLAIMCEKKGRRGIISQQMFVR